VPGGVQSVIVPFPRPLTTPPVTQTYFIFWASLLLREFLLALLLLLRQPSIGTCVQQ
jgi:hypothetical protein